MAMQLNIGEAKSRLSQMVAASLRGEEVILSRAGKPVARITAIEGARAEEKARIVADRAAKMKAFVGSLKDTLPAGAGDMFLDPTFSAEELDSFSGTLG
jgi:prevent-host-death family protein